MPSLKNLSYCLSDGGVLQEVVVEIERPRHQKAFLGGYRHRLTGMEYHHAAVQTLPKRRPDRGVAVFSRDTQVQKTASKAPQFISESKLGLNKSLHK